jgi:hypothetical protein
VNGVLVAAPTTAVAGNRIGIVMAGTLTGLVGAVTVAVQRVWSGADQAVFTIKGSLPNGDDPVPVPTLMAFAAAQSLATGYSQKYRGATATVRYPYGNAVFTSVAIPPGSLGAAY